MADEEKIIDGLTAIIGAAVPDYLPNPGPQAAWRPDPQEPGESAILTRAGYAVRDLLDLGASTQLLYDVARGIAFGAITASLRVLADDTEGELAGELYASVNALTGDE